MSRGIGRLQQRILQVLARPSEPAFRFAVDIANALFPPRASRSSLVSVRNALASLGRRRLVWSRFDATLDARGIVSGLPWTRMPPRHDAQPMFGAPCRCCPGGQDAFRATLDHAGARRLLGLPPEATEAAASRGEVPPANLPPAGVKRTRIPIDALGNQLIVTMKTASRETGRDAPRGSPWEYAALDGVDDAIREGWIPRPWATERVRRTVEQQYGVDRAYSYAHKVAGRVLRRLEAAGLIEFGTIVHDPCDRVPPRRVFVRLLDKSCLESGDAAKANDSQGPSSAR